ncbi:Ppx/GppA family phosphatase [Rhodocaloribacter litoris]|uniref:Ppx/GppA phosphatase family protein n=1 Tax=Rhodocaloribacter litoris TaxID=2558931 RepID=UPI0014238EE2|nr:Ppx/GppA phosphatase family protein [Rhodocaloribacter litoris]QXD14994.1 Ppx/GppA family phosphatase [Rhodocaloribacter litoris]
MTQQETAGHGIRRTAQPSDPGEDGGLHPVRVCVIDLGTNSFHTVIVDAYPNGAFKVIDRLKDMVRLGEGGLVAHRLTGEAMERGVQALRRIRLLAEGWGVSEYLAYATSAIREAENGGDFIARVQAEVGLHIRPISGNLEATLIYKGVRRAVSMPEPALLVDIGGGSTEFIVGTSRKLHYAASLKLGAARMTERFLHTDPVEKQEFRALRAYYREQLAPVYAAVRAHGAREIVGSSGTMENLAQVYLHLQGLSGASPFHEVFDPKAFRQVTKKIMRSTRAERAAMPGIDEKRIDQIVAGAMLVDVLLKDLEVERLRLSPNALREGMVVHFIEQNSKRLRRLAPFTDVRRRSVYELGFRFRWEQEHARHVAALALELFDVCHPLHGLDEDARELLEYAALLHDVGYHISHRRHHKHTCYLIRHADLRGFQPEEVAVIACVARYHRRAFPKKSHRVFGKLSKEHRRLVRQLAALLRLAEGLDRSHFQNVTRLDARLLDEALHLRLETKADPELEVWGARHAADLFEATFGRGIEVTAARLPETGP